jgi:hypothetical protein
MGGAFYVISLAENAYGVFSGIRRGVYFGGRQKAWLLRGHCPLTLPARHR